jgi:hypothetical protein
MKSISITVLPLVFCLVGCGGYQHAENVDLGQAQSALRTALEAWKDGKANADLQPTIIMNESDWTSGCRLLDFRMEESGVLDGRQARWVAHIKLQDRSGAVKEHKATYIIDTIPRIVIVRDTFAS